MPQNRNNAQNNPEHGKDSAYDVFISYSHFDENVMLNMCSFLEKKGIRCWYAPRDILPGRDYPEAIIHAIRKCKVFIIICSNHSLKSRFARSETSTAFSNDKIIIPFRIEDCFFDEPWMQLFLSLSQWINAFPHPEKHFDVLANAILDRIDSPYSSDLPPASSGEKRMQEETNEDSAVAEGDLSDEAVNYMKSIRKYAIRGDAEALCNLGMCYKYGYGVPKNDIEAVKRYRKSAEQGVAEAQCCLGKCYYWEEGVKLNYTEAVEWFRRAANQGFTEALYWLGICYFWGNGVVESSLVAAKLFRKAAEQGHAMAQHSLGLCYEYEVGVPKNKSEAVKWYRLAAEQGDKGAQEELKRLGIED